ncbi:helix-turn-helix domain-containing protein [Aureimonas ureilytica]|uniref:helix-turn-helix domain-containing protein n=1 Tax=Aureimonas ureilytica TaxID=401562 RepID=UPI0009DC14DD|nr:helix-turn-helix transcriptional regulator [Aureimonas ureilytica]
MQPAPVDKDAQRLYLRKQAGLWLKKKREEAGLTQRDLAAILDLKIYTFVSQVESGNGRLPFDRYSEWARALKIDEYDFAAKALSYYEPALFELVLSGSPRKPDFDI